MPNADLDDIQVIEIPDDAVIVTHESALAPAADPAPSPMDTIMRFKFFVIALLVIAGIVSAPGLLVSRYVCGDHRHAR